MPAERLQGRQLLGSRPRGQRADLQRRDERVPAGLQLHHGEVVGVVELPGVGPDPVQLDGLALDGSAGHPGDRLQDAQSRPKAHPLHVVQERLQRQRQHRVAHVDRDRNAVVHVQGGPAAAQQRLVLDIVVDEEGVVVELQRGRGRQDRLDPAAQTQAGGDAQGRPYRLSAAVRVVEDQLEQGARFRAVGGVQPPDLGGADLLAGAEVVVELHRGHRGHRPVRGGRRRRRARPSPGSRSGYGRPSRSGRPRSRRRPPARAAR